MEDVLREGGLRVVASEASCDVVLSCAGRRLTAHRVILSIASPLLQTILLEETSTPAVIVLPEIQISTMGLILDYIYTGSAHVPQEKINDFLEAASLLKIQVCNENILKLKFLKCALSLKERQTESHIDERKTEVSKKALRKVPDLLPISRKSVRSYVIPSPWCPRLAPLIGDPRIDRSMIFRSDETSDSNDKNNNSQVMDFGKKPEMPEPLLTNDTVIKENPKAIVTNPKDPNKATTTTGKPFKCDDCGKSFSQLRNYKYHRSIHEGTKEFSARCPECGKTFNDKGYLSSHMKIHRDRKEYGCPHCPKRFNQRVAYNMHLRIHTGVKPHECPTCGKTFSRKMLLKQHQRVHTGERPYSCPECGKTFADRSNMSLHARLHTGVKPYTCNVCSKSFTKKHHLKTHMNFHTGLKPYSCQKCGLSFSQSSNMRTHYKKCILKTNVESENS